MRSYENIFILKPGLDANEIKTQVDKVSELITKSGGSITLSESWGDKKLAYEINKHKHGHYEYFVFESESACLSQLENYFRITENVIRHSIILQPKNSDNGKDSSEKVQEPSWQESEKTSEESPKKVSAEKEA